MPITDRSQAKDGGFAQVRGALQKFKGIVTSAEFGQWGGQLIDPDTGKPLPPREFLEVQCEEVEVLEVTEELSMEITEWNFRVNCSDFNGSFWVDKFLESADRFKVQIPEGLVGKRITWEKVTLEAFDKAGEPNPRFNAINYVIAGIEAKAPARVAPKVAVKLQAPKTQVATAVAKTIPVVEEVATEEAGEADPMEAALKVAIGKTEAQFRTAIVIDPAFSGSPLVSLAKAGMVTQALVNEGKLVKVKKGTQEVYQLPS